MMRRTNRLSFRIFCGRMAMSREVSVAAEHKNGLYGPLSHGVMPYA